MRMHEIQKIQEAKYFYGQMENAGDNTDIFKYNLSAFLAAARSVLQFALNEAQLKPGGLKWYKSAVTGNQTVSFFKDKRNVNIHHEPVGVIKHVEIKLAETISISESIHIIVKNQQGEVVRESKTESETPEPRKEIPSEISYRHKFDDWTGNEDIPTLCRAYLADLEKVVAHDKGGAF